jgi:hypothetical protein
MKILIRPKRSSAYFSKAGIEVTQARIVNKPRIGIAIGGCGIEVNLTKFRFFVTIIKSFQTTKRLTIPTIAVPAFQIT